MHTQTRAAIMQALWLYIKHNQLQDGHEREYINCNRYFRQVSWDAVPPLASQPLPCPLLQSPTGLVVATFFTLTLGWSTSPCAFKGMSKFLVLSPDLQLWPTPFL